jgi:hypothetical protein
LFPTERPPLPTIDPPQELPLTPPDYGSIDTELSELYEWRKRARNVGLFSVVGLLGFNFGIDYLDFLSSEFRVLTAITTAGFCLFGYYTYRLNYQVERLVIQTLVLQRQVIELRQQTNDIATER